MHKAAWTPVIGELLLPRAEDDNEHDDAVAVVKGGDVVGYVPSRVACSS